MEKAAGLNRPLKAERFETLALMPMVPATFYVVFSPSFETAFYKALIVIAHLAVVLAVARYRWAVGRIIWSAALVLGYSVLILGLVVAAMEHISLGSGTDVSLFIFLASMATNVGAAINVWSREVSAWLGSKST